MGAMIAAPFIAFGTILIMATLYAVGYVLVVMAGAFIVFLFLV